MRHGGCITAAGASSRMGYPKALLRFPDGTPLARHQAQQLALAGCADVVVVLGADAERIAPHLEGVQTTINPRWADGRLTSIQAGLRALGACEGCFILPVDAVGVKPDTWHRLREAAESGRYEAVRPAYQGQPGHLVWCARRIMDDLILLKIDPDTPLNQWLAPHTHFTDVDDPAILRNVNTPEQWEGLMGDGQKFARE